jgi:hypothetical protein
MESTGVRLIFLIDLNAVVEDVWWDEKVEVSIEVFAIRGMADVLDGFGSAGRLGDDPWRESGVDFGVVAELEVELREEGVGDTTWGAEVCCPTTCGVEVLCAEDDAMEDLESNDTENGEALVRPIADVRELEWWMNEEDDEGAEGVSGEAEDENEGKLLDEEGNNEGEGMVSNHNR